MDYFLIAHVLLLIGSFYSLLVTWFDVQGLEQIDLRDLLIFANMFAGVADGSWFGILHQVLQSEQHELLFLEGVRIVSITV